VAFPSVVGTPAGTADTSSTSYTVALPAGIVAGELLVIFMAFDGVGTVTQSSGSTFTRIDTAVNGTACQEEIWVRLATGGESSPVFSNTNSQDVACVAIRVQNHGVTDVTTDITKGTAATGADAAPDPPNCNPGTVQDFLWLECFAADDDDDTVPFESANYTAVLQQQSASSTSSCLVAVASRQLNASSENPGVMAMAAVEEWVAQTIAIKPITQQTHTTDSLLKATLDKTHTTDSLLKATTDKTHSTDSLLKATADKTHSTDSLLKAALDGIHSTDSLLKAESTLTHSTDSFLAAGGVDVAHSTDSLLEAEQSATHLTDSLLKADQSKTHSTDSLIEAEQDRTHSTDSLLEAEQGRTHSTDSLLKAEQGRTHSTDSLLEAEQNKTHSADSLLQSTLDKTHSTDSLLKATASPVHTTDSMLYGTVEKTHSTDSYLIRTLDKTHSTDSYLVDVSQFTALVLHDPVLKGGQVEAFVVATFVASAFLDADGVPACTVYKYTAAGLLTVHATPVLVKRVGVSGLYDGSFTPDVIAAAGAPEKYLVTADVTFGGITRRFGDATMALAPCS